MKIYAGQGRWIILDTAIPDYRNSEPQGIYPELAEVEAGGFVDALLCAWGAWVCPSCQTYVDPSLECMCEITGIAHTPRPL